MKLYLWTASFVTLLTLASCNIHATNPLDQNGQTSEVNFATPPSTSTSYPAISPTLTPSVTVSLTNTPTITSTASNTPTLTQTPTPILPVSKHTPFPQPLTVISVENINQLRELARYGEPLNYKVLITQDKKRIIVSNALGIWIYDRENQKQIGFIDIYIMPETKYDPSLFINQDGTKFAVLTPNDIRILDDNNNLLDVFPYPENANKYYSRIKFSPDLTLFAFYASENPSSFQVWDVIQKKILFEGIGFVQSFSDNGHYLLAYSTLYEVGSWEIIIESSPALSNHRGGLLSPGGQLLAFFL